MNPQTRRMISAALFSFGVCFALVGCARMPGAIFVIGDNDAPAEVWAIILCFPIFLTAAVLAFWTRKLSGFAMLAAATLWFYGEQAERTYMQTVRHFPQGSYKQFLLGSLLPSWLFLALGLFAIATRSWPEVLPKQQKSDTEL